MGAEETTRYFDHDPCEQAPAAESTSRKVLKRNGVLLWKRRKRWVYKLVRQELTGTVVANDIWMVDFKDWYVTKDEQRILSGARRLDPVDSFRRGRVCRRWFLNNLDWFLSAMGIRQAVAVQADPPRVDGDCRGPGLQQPILSPHQLGEPVTRTCRKPGPL